MVSGREVMWEGGDEGEEKTGEGDEWSGRVIVMRWSTQGGRRNPSWS